MRCIFSPLLLMVLLSTAVYSQTSNPRPPNTPPAPGESSSQQQQVQPASVPLPADSPMPDLGTLPDSQDKKQSAAKRKLQEVVPHCLNIFAFHTCWSQPPAPKPIPGVSLNDDPEFAKDMDVGDFYLTEKKNYKGAELRFRDALEHKPNDPTATFRLAQSLEGLKQADEARDTYAAYLKLEPTGAYAPLAKKALDRLQANSASQGDKAKP